jgi:hypothetical protein
MKVSQEFEKQSRRNLNQIWQYIGYDLLAVQEECEGKDWVTGEDLRWIIPDYLHHSNNPKWVKEFQSLPDEERERLLYLAFPKNMHFGY